MDNKKQAQGIASLGRYGDTTLMHMRPEEVNQLTAISRANGGDITINPKTGLPEAFLGDFIGSLAPTIAGLGAGAFFGPAGGAFAGGLTSYLQGKRDPLSIGMGALGGYGGANIGANLVATAPTATTAGGALSNAGVNTTQGINMTTGERIGNIASTTAQGNAVPAGINMTTGEIMTAPGTQGFMGGATPSTLAQGPNIDTTLGARMGQVNVPDRPAGFDYALTPEKLGQSNVAPQTNIDALNAPQPKTPFQSGFEYAQNQFGKLAEGTKSVFTDSTKRGEFFGRMGGAEYDNLGNLVKPGNETYGMLKTAMPFAGAGVEAYGKYQYDNLPQMGAADVYDPYATLNLSQPTGLQLLAKGGSVKRYQAGGTTAMQNSYGMNTPIVASPVGSQGLSSLNINTPTAEINKAAIENNISQLTPEQQQELANMTPEEIYALYGAQMQGQEIAQPIGQPITQPITQPLAQPQPMSELSLTDNQSAGGEEQMAKGGRVKGYAEGGETALNLNTGEQEQLNPSKGYGDIRDAKISMVGDIGQRNNIQTLGGFLDTMPINPGMPIGNPGSFDNIKTLGDFLNVMPPRSNFPIGALAKGGRVKGYAEGGETSADYGVVPDYSFQIGRGLVRNPVMGNINVAGKFNPDPQGTLSDIEFEKEYSALWDSQDKYGAYNPSQFGSPNFGQAVGPSGIGNIIAAAAPVASSLVSNMQNAPSESQSLGTLEEEKMAKGGKVKGYADGGITTIGKTDYDLSKAQGNVIQKDGKLIFGDIVDMFRTVDTTPTVLDNGRLIFGNPIAAAGYVAQNTFGLNNNLPSSPSNNTALNLNTGKQEPMAKGGRVRYAEGGISALTPDDGKMLNGDGDGVSDDIPAMIEGEQQAALSDGEFIIPARIVSELGNGSSDAGAKKLYNMIDKIQALRNKTMGDKKQYANDTNAERYLPI